MTRRPYVLSRDTAWRRLVEAVHFGLAGVFYALAWPFPNRWVSAVLAPLGGLVALWHPGARRRAEANIAHVWPAMPPAARRSLVRRAGAAFACLAVEYARFERLPRHPERCRVTAGAGVMGAVAASGRGAVIVTAHFGNWEAIRVASRAAGVECGIIYRAFNNRFLDAYTLKLIAAGGEPVLQKGLPGSRRLVSHVMRGGTVLILVDQRFTGAPMIDFLGQPCETALAAAEIARRAKVPLIPAVAVRTSMTPHFDVRFEAPVADGEPIAMMAEVNRRIGAWVTEHPEQWLWFHRRWGKAVRQP